MADLRLDGRRVLVTGGESGIGRATALRAAQEGAHVAVIGLDAAGLEAVAAEVEEAGQTGFARVADVSDADAIAAAVDAAADALGGLDVVHANAGILMQATTLGELDLDVWRRVVDVNLSGVLYTFRAGLPHVRAAGGGLLLATGSSTAIRPGAGMLAYVAAKAGVHTLCRSLALELAPEKIRVVVLAPGLTSTPMTQGMAGHIDRGLPLVPTGELVDANDVAALAVHAMSDEGRSITGVVLSIDAGRTAA